MASAQRQEAHSPTPGEDIFRDAEVDLNNEEKEMSTAMMAERVDMRQLMYWLPPASIAPRLQTISTYYHHTHDIYDN